jgi:hypothetical protein
MPVARTSTIIRLAMVAMTRSFLVEQAFEARRRFGGEGER